MRSTKMFTILVLSLGLIVCAAAVSKAAPIGTAFTYQGRLMDDNQPANGLYDLECKLFDSSDPCAAQVGPKLSFENGEILDGYFTLLLDFGVDIFDGNERWLELGIRPGDSNDVYTSLSPRQEVTPTPYALYARTAGNALIGSSTTNRIAKFTGPNTLGDSALYEHNYYVGVGTTNPRGMFDVDCEGGDIYLDTFSSQVYIGDVDGNGDGTLFTVDDSVGKFTFENGKVGIGTTNPASSLEVISPVNTHAIRATANYIPVYALRTAPTGTWPAVEGDCNSLYNGASAIRGKILSTTPGSLSAGVYGYNSGEGTNGVGVRGHHVGSGTGVYGQCDNGYGGYFIGAKNYFGGNVGIGTTNPRTDLEIEGTTGLRVTTGQLSSVFGDIKHAYSGGLIINSHAGGGSFADMSLQTNATTRVFIDSGGNVGIGTTSPAAILHVAGMARVEAVQITGADVAEKFPVSEEVKPGMVVMIDTENQGSFASLEVSITDVLPVL